MITLDNIIFRMEVRYCSKGIICIIHCVSMREVTQKLLGRLENKFNLVTHIYQANIVIFGQNSDVAKSHAIPIWPVGVLPRKCKWCD